MTGVLGSAMNAWIRERLAEMLESDDEMLRGLRFFFGEAEKSEAPRLLRELEPFFSQTLSVPDSSQEPHWQRDAYRQARAPLGEIRPLPHLAGRAPHEIADAQGRCAEEAREVVRRLLVEV